jgi:cell division initiation protein
MSENESRQRLTITDIESKMFRRVAYGYDQHEVDEFLDCICDEMEQLQRELNEKQGEIDMANAELRKAEAASGFVQPAPTTPENSFREILEMAQRVKDQTIADAQRRAEEIVSDARAQAEAELGGLEETRNGLLETVRGLREKARGYRDAIAGLIREQQEALDALDLGDDE